MKKDQSTESPVAALNVEVTRELKMAIEHAVSQIPGCTQKRFAEYAIFEFMRRLPIQGEGSLHEKYNDVSEDYWEWVKSGGGLPIEPPSEVNRSDRNRDRAKPPGATQWIKGAATLQQHTKENCSSSKKEAG